MLETDSRWTKGTDMVIFMISGLSGVHSELDMEDAEDLFLSFTRCQGKQKTPYKTQSRLSEKKTGSAGLPPTIPRVPFTAGFPKFSETTAGSEASSTQQGWIGGDFWVFWYDFGPVNKPPLRPWEMLQCFFEVGEKYVSKTCHDSWPSRRFHHVKTVMIYVMNVRETDSQNGLNMQIGEMIVVILPSDSGANLRLNLVRDGLMENQAAVPFLFFVNFMHEPNHMTMTDACRPCWHVVVVRCCD